MKVNNLDLICSEKFWNFNIIKMSNNFSKVKNWYTNQYQASCISLLLNDNTRKFIDEWYDLGCNYHNIKNW